MKNAFKLFMIAAVTSVTFAACSSTNNGSESDTSSTMSDTGMSDTNMQSDTTSAGGSNMGIDTTTKM